MSSFLTGRPVVQKSIKYIAVSLGIVLMLTFFLRNILISYYFEKKAGKFSRMYNAELKALRVHAGWNGELLITGLTLTPGTGDTLVQADSINLSFNLLKLMTGHLVIRKAELVNFRLSFINHDSVSNWMFILKRRGENDRELTGTGKGYDESADRLMDLLFDRIPDRLRMQNVTVSANTNGHEVLFHTDLFNLEDHSFSTVIRVREESSENEWDLSGRIDPSEHLITTTLFSTNDKKISLPLLDYKWGAAIGMDTLLFSFHELRLTADRSQVNGIVSFSGLKVEHEKVAAKPVLFDKLAVKYAINIGHDFAELDSSTEIIFNSLRLSPYIRYRHKPTEQITVRIIKPEFPADELFSSFPEGLFTNLGGIRVKGRLSFNLDFFADLSVPDSLIFTMDLSRHGFSVLSYGNAGLYKIDSSFLYTAWEKDKPVRTFVVGPENSSFRPLNKISPFLRYAVMTSEDGGFYQHRGFLPDAFRASLIQDIKERRFARGGSTISMQLVKNVFLSRNKTIGRKVEEALLVWLLENQGITTKDRMFEVYLNIIEWGPLVYGAGEASRFYFNKEPSKLTLAEAIFLSSVIPRPKWFRYSFDDNGHLRQSMADYYRLVSGKMLAKGWITQKDQDRLIPDVELKGPAKQLLLKKDPLPAESLQMLENPEEE